MSKKINTFLRDPPCEEAPRNGVPLMIGRRGQTSATTQMTGSGISSGAVRSNHLSRALLDVVYAGGGYDGEADFDGTATVLGHAPSGNVYTLTRDIGPTRMQVRSGVTIRPAGYKIVARELWLYGTCIIHADGGDGIDAVGATKGGAGTAILSVGSAVILGGSANGGGGGQGGETASEAGDAGAVGTSVAIGLGGDGATGVAGQASDGAGGAAGAAGTVSGTDAYSASLDNLTRLMRGVSLIHGGSGGGAGGGGGATAAAADGGGGGGGGAGGGVLMISCGALVLSSWTGRISADGGDGGNGAAGAGAAGDGGQGGGGGGGVVHLLYASISGGSLVPMAAARNATVTQAQQDATGANVTAWGGRLGTNGSGVPPTSSASIAPCGTVRVIGPDPFIPYAEIPRGFQIKPTSRPPRLHAGHHAAMAHRAPTE